jgi:hypothetical protein
MLWTGNLPIFYIDSLLFSFCRCKWLANLNRFVFYELIRYLDYVFNSAGLGQNFMINLPKIHIVHTKYVYKSRRP